MVLMRQVWVDTLLFVSFIQCVSLKQQFVNPKQSYDNLLSLAQPCNDVYVIISSDPAKTLLFINKDYFYLWRLKNKKLLMILDNKHASNKRRANWKGCSVWSKKLFSIKNTCYEYLKNEWFRWMKHTTSLFYESDQLR